MSGAALLRLDFAQMLFDGGWAVGGETALADSPARGWLRSDEALGLSLDLGLRHFTRLKLLASLGGRRGVGLMRDGLRRDIYPKLADSEAGDWMEDHLYGRLHASLMALTSSATGDILRRAAMVLVLSYTSFQPMLALILSTI